MREPKPNWTVATSGGGSVPPHTTHFDDCGCLSARLAAEIAALKAELKAANRRTELAEAHDTQPYPTAHAYEKVCETLHKQEARLAEARLAVGRFVSYLRCGEKLNDEDETFIAAFLREAEERKGEGK